MQAFFFLIIPHTLLQTYNIPLSLVKMYSKLFKCHFGLRFVGLNDVVSMHNFSTPLHHLISTLGTSSALVFLVVNKSPHILSRYFTDMFHLNSQKNIILLSLYAFTWYLSLIRKGRHSLKYDVD